MPDDGFKFFRVIGWQTIKGQLYWIFTYTKSQKWGLGNYRLVAHGKYDLKFANVLLK
jgi:hypothetical protein